MKSAGTRAGMAALALLVMISLESAARAADIEWLVNSSGFWDEPSNWSSNPALPGPTDQVTIDQPGDVFEITHRTGDTVLENIASSEAVYVKGGTFSVTSGASVLQSGFSVESAAFRAIGPGTTFNVLGSGAIKSGAEVAALDGAQIDFRYTDRFSLGFERIDVRAEGQGSRIRFGDLSNFGAYPIYLSAVGSGSQIELPDMHYVDSSVDITLSDGGDLNAPDLRHMKFGSLQMISSGDFQFARNLLILERADVTASDQAIVSFDSLNVLHQTSVRASTGASIDFPSLQELSFEYSEPMTLAAEGEQSRIGFPLLHEIHESDTSGGANSTLEISAVGAQAAIDMSALERIIVYEEDINLPAVGDGARIDLGRLTTIAGQNRDWNKLNIVADGTNSRIDLNSLTEMTMGLLTVTVRGAGATIDMSALIGGGLGGDVTVADGGELLVNGVTEYRHGKMLLSGPSDFAFTREIQRFKDATLEVRAGAAPDLTAVNEVSSTDLIAADGGKLRLPALTRITQSVGGYRKYPLWALGRNSQLDLSKVTDVSTVSFLDIRSVGRNSVVDLSSLSEFPFGAGIFLQQGDLLTPGWEDLFGFELEIAGAGDYEFTKSIESLRGGKLSVRNRATPNLGNVNHVQNTYFTVATGGEINMPNVTVLDVETPESGWTFALMSSGSTIRLPSVPSLPHSVKVYADGENTLLDFASLTSIPEHSFIWLQQGAILHAPLVTQLKSVFWHASGASAESEFLTQIADIQSNVELVLENFDRTSLTNLRNMRNSRIQLRNGNLELPAMADLPANTDLEVTRGEFYMPAIENSTVTAGLLAQEGGRFSLPNWRVNKTYMHIAIEGDEAELFAPKLQLNMLGGTFVVRSGGTAVLSHATFSGGTVVIEDNESVELAGSWLNLTRDPERMDTASGVLQFAGDGIVAFEVAGSDLGISDDRDANGGNFGLGQLVVGNDASATRMTLVDLVDNGQRLGDEADALYLFGTDGAGLRLLGGSTLFIGGPAGGIDVYAAMGGSMVRLHDLFLTANSSIAFDQGFLSNRYLGDVDQSGRVDGVDIDLIYDSMESGTFDELADIDGDGFVDLEDVNQMLDGVLATTFGDVNLNGNVDVADLNLIRNNFGLVGGWSIGDIDGNGLVGIGDLNAVRNQFGFRRSGGAFAVPEPASIGLALFFVGLAMVRSICYSKSSWNTSVECNAGRTRRLRHRRTVNGHLASNGGHDDWA